MVSGQQPLRLKKGARTRLKQGPAGILISSLAQAGGCLLPDCSVQFPGERKFDLLQGPNQWLRGQVMAPGRAARMRSWAERRGSFAHIGHIDCRTLA